MNTLSKIHDDYVRIIALPLLIFLKYTKMDTESAYVKCVSK